MWTATDRRRGIEPGEFRDFPLSVVIPGKAGPDADLQGAADLQQRQVVRWIGAPGADEPAPQVKLTAAASGRATRSRQQANPRGAARRRARTTAAARTR